MPEGRRLRIGRLRAREVTGGGATSAPPPPTPQRDEGLAEGRAALGCACASAGAGEGRLQRRSRAPWAPFPSPTPLVRPRGHRPWGRGPGCARARPSWSSLCRAPRRGRNESVHGNARRREHAVSKLDPGAAKEKRASGLGARAPPKGCSRLRVTLPWQAGLSESRWWGCLRLGGAGAAGSGRGRLELGDCLPVLH